MRFKQLAKSVWGLDKCFLKIKPLQICSCIWSWSFYLQRIGGIEGKWCVSSYSYNYIISLKEKVTELSKLIVIYQGLSSTKTNKVNGPCKPKMSSALK